MLEKAMEGIPKQTAVAKKQLEELR